MNLSLFVSLYTLFVHFDMCFMYQYRLPFVLHMCLFVTSRGLATLWCYAIHFAVHRL